MLIKDKKTKNLMVGSYNTSLYTYTLCIENGRQQRVNITTKINKKKEKRFLYKTLFKVSGTNVTGRQMTRDIVRIH